MFNNAFFTTLFGLFGVFISFINQIIIAHYFGVHQNMDIFFSITSFAGIIGGVLGLAINYSLLPFFEKIKINYNDKYEIYIKYFSLNFLKSLSIVFLFGLFLSFIYIKFYLKIVDYRFYLLSLFTFSSLFININFAIYASFFQTIGKYIKASSINIFVPLTSILFIILFSTFIDFLSIQFGVFLGSLISLFLLKKELKNTISYNSVDVDNALKNDIQQFKKDFVFYSFGVITFTIHQFSDSFWNNTLESSTVSYYAYLQRIIASITIISIYGPSVVLASKFNEYFTTKSKQDFKNLFFDTIFLTIIITSLITVYFYTYSKELLALLFYKSKIIEKDILIMSKIFKNLLIGLPFIVSFSFIFRALFIENNKKKILLIGLTSGILYFCLSGLLIIVQKNIGISIAYYLSWIIVFVIGIVSLKKFFELNFVEISIFFLSIIKLFFISVFLIISIPYINNLFNLEQTFISILLKSLVGFFITLFLYLVCLYIVNKEIFKKYKSKIVKKNINVPNY